MGRQRPHKRTVRKTGKTIKAGRGRFVGGGNQLRHPDWIVKKFASTKQYHAIGLYVHKKTGAKIRYYYQFEPAAYYVFFVDKYSANEWKYTSSTGAMKKIKTLMKYGGSEFCPIPVEDQTFTSGAKGKGKKLRVVVYNDPGHAWAKVPKADLKALGIAGDISSCSYQKEEYAYLEEDSDLPKYIAAMAKKLGVKEGTPYNEWIEWVEYSTDSESPIRWYARYNPLR